MMSSSQKSQFRSDNTRNEQNHEDRSRRVPFRAIPINRKNQLSADNLDSLSRRNERNKISIDTPTNSQASNKRHHVEDTHRCSSNSLSNAKTSHKYYHEEDDRSDNDLENDSIQDVKKTRRDNYVADTTPRTTATTRRAPLSNRSSSNSDTSPLGDSGSIANDDVYDRVDKLECDVALLKNQVRRLLSQGPPPASSIAIELTPFQVSVIGRIVRDEMFKAIKFMDATTIQVQGQKLFLRCLQAGKLEDQSDNKYLFDLVIKRARKSLNIFKSHVKSDIRKAARYQYARDGGVATEDHWFSYVREFRAGFYEEASDVVQNAWVTYVDNILGNVNRQWKSSMSRSNTNVSDVVTVSDEAYAMMVSQLDILTWIEKGFSQAKEGDMEKSDSLSQKNGHVDGEDDEDGSSNDLRAKYERIYRDLLEKKKTDIDAWLSWDKGYKERISVSLQKKANTPTLKKGNYSGSINDTSNNEPEPEFEEW